MDTCRCFRKMSLVFSLILFCFYYIFFSSLIGRETFPQEELFDVGSNMLFVLYFFGSRQQMKDTGQKKGSGIREQPRIGFKAEAKTPDVFRFIVEQDWSFQIVSLLLIFWCRKIVTPTVALNTVRRISQSLLGDWATFPLLRHYLSDLRIDLYK